ncbi:MAG: carbohydrate ABC transporter permease, partial [Armatimonadota bacterium]
MRTAGTRLQAYLFVTPALVVFAVFVLYPMLATLVLGLFSWKAMSAERHWVGLANYAELLRDPLFFLCLKNNGLWIVLSLVLQLPVALLLAVALNSRLTRLRALRTAFFTPFVLPVVAAALIWWLILEPNFGLANALLRACSKGLARVLAALGVASAGV